jgi:GNAT superfamily N-acetyltransferase
MSLSAGVEVRSAVPGDAAACLLIRGKTRQNAATPEKLAEYGITAQTWHDDIASGTLSGYVAVTRGSIIGYCYGNKQTGEIAVLALLPEYEGRGIGRELLERTVKHLIRLGHKRLFLGCSSDPATRSHGFYRHLGWKSTGSSDSHGDEVLELVL